MFKEIAWSAVRGRPTPWPLRCAFAWWRVLTLPQERRCPICAARLPILTNTQVGHLRSEDKPGLEG